MPLSIVEIIKHLPHARLAGSNPPPITGISYDSRNTSPGDLFVCIKGFVYDGHDFADQAVKKGAAALLVERKLPIATPQIVVDNTRHAMGVVAARLFDFPSRKLRLIGVTGTNGKTTTTYLIRSIFQQAGKTCGLVGTIEQSTGDEAMVGVRTTPESADIQRLLNQMVQEGCTVAALEVSSHSMVLHRTVGTEFDIAIFTNLSQDHLDFHQDLDDYREAKALLFRSLNSYGHDEMKRNKCAVINGDDLAADYFVKASTAPVITYGLSDGCDIRAWDIDVRADGVRYTVTTPQGEGEVRLKLPGRFNVYNSLAAIAVALHEDIPLNVALRGIENTVVPGRFEPVNEGQDFTVIVDYAHTPDSLENVLQTARSLTRGKIITVVGAGGDRDKTKRPLMGETASELSDYVVVTSDNPRSENPRTICDEIAEGIRRKNGLYEIVIDRREGIQRAVEVAGPGDLVLIAGKGHETYQEFADHKIHFDDREEVRKALRQRFGN